MYPILREHTHGGDDRSWVEYCEPCTPAFPTVSFVLLGMLGLGSSSNASHRCQRGRNIKKWVLKAPLRSPTLFELESSFWTSCSSTSLRGMEKFKKSDSLNRSELQISWWATKGKERQIHCGFQRGNWDKEGEKKTFNQYN